VSDCEELVGFTHRWWWGSLPHLTSYPLLMLVLRNMLIKYTPFCTPKCSSYAGIWLWEI